MATFTTEQSLPVTFKVVDGRGRTVPAENITVVSSDETVAQVADQTESGFNIISGAPGNARILMTADAEIGEGVNEIMGTLDVEVTLDPRTAARTVELTAGEPVDEAV